MKKYLLLLIPIFYYKNSILYFSLEDVLNLMVIVICLAFLLKHTTLQHVFHWGIAICFVFYFCVLYEKTIYFRGFLNVPHHYYPNGLRSLFNTFNWIPLRGIIEEIRINPSLISALYQIFGNVFLLMPFAFSMLYFKWVKSYRRAIGYSMICTLTIESIQFLQNVYYCLFFLGLRRSVDIDDIILNTIGAIIGIGCYFLWSKFENRFRDREMIFG
jgi:glycopeptide antibiotics resistance protein